MPLTCSIPELTGLLTELYLLATTCLPASSLLLQRDPTRGIAPAHKLLIEILFFQLFTFPLLAWPEVRPVLTRLLTRTSLSPPSPAEFEGTETPPRLIAVLSFFYFLYENSQLNTADSASSLQTQPPLHHDLANLAANLAVSVALLKQYPPFLALSQDRRADLRRVGRRAVSRGVFVVAERAPRRAALPAAAAPRLRGSGGRL